MDTAQSDWLKHMAIDQVLQCEEDTRAETKEHGSNAIGVFL